MASEIRQADGKTSEDVLYSSSLKEINLKLLNLVINLGYHLDE